MNTGTGNAMALVTAAKSAGALVFANIENMEAKVDLYRTEVTQITFKENDFHTINGKKMPNKAATDRIGEAAGVYFIESACKVVCESRDDPLCGKRNVFCATAQGKVRMPDGSWRESTIDEYEFDPVLRAMLDKSVTELNDKTRPVVGKAIMELQKVAKQRAATGARLRVIRQLTGMPSAFEATEYIKPMVFTRVVQNTDFILKTPEGKAMATAQALGVDISKLWGGGRNKMIEAQPQNAEETEAVSMKNVTPAAEDATASLVAQAAEPDEPEFPDEPTGPGSKPEDPFVQKSLYLEEIMTTYKDALNVMSKNQKNPYNMAEEELKNPNATVETRDSMIERLRTWLKAKGINV
jgi:hypothetical protein